MSRAAQELPTGTVPSGTPRVERRLVGSRGTIVRAEGPLPLDDVRQIGEALGETLRAAHETGVVHRDLRPANPRWAKRQGAAERTHQLEVLDGLAQAIGGAPSTSGWSRVVDIEGPAPPPPPNRRPLSPLAVVASLLGFVGIVGSGLLLLPFGSR